MTSAQQQRTDRDRLLELINASWTTQAIAAAVELRIPDLLAEGPRDVGALARAACCHAPSLERLLHALASLDLVEGSEAGTYALTRAGALLRTDAGDSLAWWARLCGSRSWAAWAGLAESVRTGQSRRARAGRSDDFSDLEDDRAAAAVFHRAMCDLTKPIAEAVAATIDFTGTDKIVDVGGGYGRLLSTILARHRSLRGILFDLEHAMASAGPELAREGVADRVKLVSGSFFESIPEGADAYLLKSVLHDWNDEHCMSILRACARAMTAGRSRAPRLLVIERLRPERFAPTRRDQAIARSDLNMLVSLGGRERTEREYRALLSAAGFRVMRITELPGEFSVVEARPVVQAAAPSGH
jgi:hypothetical protein